jgi:hypothetical protein
MSSTLFDFTRNTRRCGMFRSGCTRGERLAQLDLDDP